MNKNILPELVLILGVLGISNTAFSSEKIRLSLSGKMEQYFFITDKSNKANLTGALSDVELYFTGSTVLDNGVKVEARIEVEAETGGKKNVDEQYLDISGAFGLIRIGESEGFNHSLSYEVPYAAYSDDEIVGRIVPSKIRTVIKDSLTFERFTGDSFQLGFQSRSILGFTVATSFFPTTDEGRDKYIDKSVADYNAWEFNGKWSGRIKGARLGLVMGYFNSKSSGGGSDGESAWNISSQVQLGGLKIGGSLVKSSPDNNSNSTSWAVGSLYNIGGVGIGVSYLSIMGKDSRRILGGERLNQAKLEGSFLVSKGIKLGVSTFWVSQRGFGLTREADIGLIGSAILRF